MEIQIWRELLDPYQLAVDELVVKFEHIIEEHNNKGLYSPIELVIGRVKSIDSILDKMYRKDISLGELEERIEDIAGIRITCQFVEDIDRVVEMIKKRSDMDVLQEKDYVSHMKSSGYRSYHMIISYVVNTMEGPKEIHAEIQIRTLAMDFWATIEHSLQYKYKDNIPDHIQKKLIDASEAIIVLDRAMSDVRDEIMDAQNTNKIRENLIKDILNNIQNLYKVANKGEVSRIQEEFYKVYLTEDMGKLQHFSRQLDVIAEGFQAQSL